jgi:hypothetical protein
MNVEHQDFYKRDLGLSRFLLGSPSGSFPAPLEKVKISHDSGVRNIPQLGLDPIIDLLVFRSSTRLFRHALPHSSY